MKKSEPVLSTTAQQPKESDTAAGDDKEHSDVLSHKGVDTGKIDTYIVLSDENTVINGKGAAFENNVLTISKGGIYSLSGQLTDGKIYVNSTDAQNQVKLHLDGVTVSCDEGAPLHVEKSPLQTVIMLCDDTVNSFSDTGDKKEPDEANGNAAVIYSRDEILIEGEGVLDIRADFNKGILIEKNINISDGYIHIDARQSEGISCEGSVNMSDGTLVIFGPQGTGKDVFSCAGQFNVSDGTLLAVGDEIESQIIMGNDDVRVLTYTCSEPQKGLNVITEEDGEAVVGFKSSKGFKSLVLADEELDEDDVYSLSHGGSINGEEYCGVYFDSRYTAGTQVGVLS